MNKTEQCVGSIQKDLPKGAYQKHLNDWRVSCRKTLKAHQQVIEEYEDDV